MSRQEKAVATGPALAVRVTDGATNWNNTAPQGWDAASSDSSEYDPASAFMKDVDETEEPRARKRKSIEPTGSIGGKIAKKARLVEDGKNGSGSDSSSRPDMARQLPAEIWHHIFTLLPPRTLGTLLLVNKLFHSYLDPSSRVKTAHPVPTTPSIRPALKPDAIWQASRRLFWPRMPAPLKYSRPDQAETGQAQPQWHRGPGATGVSPVFPFFVVSCGQCLSETSVKEIDLVLSSSTPSVLLPGLSVVFITPELHVIPPQVIRSGAMPPDCQVSKVYWPRQIEDIKTELEAVKTLGTAAAEEWIKGLEARGKGALADTSRWEKWYLSGGVRQMRMRISAASSASADKHSASLSYKQVSKGDINGPGTAAKNRRDADQSLKPGGLVKSAPDTLSIPPKLQTRPQGQQKWSKEEVAELRAKRRAEIELRASRLQPPINPSVLSHIPSFQAALQIVAPFSDKAWELLKPRLMAQRQEAEQRERNSIANASALQGRLGAISRNNGKNDEIMKEVTDEEWDEAQGPLRARISGFADEIIRDGWADGQKIKKRNCSQFAAEVLLYVRKRFYAEVAKDAAAARTAGVTPIVDPPEGPWTQKLTLENMKWIFDLKIRPLTDRHRKSLFLCHGCVGNYKCYGFEAVIQHYAAKHTSALSKGNVVVYWRAEWPAEPVFNSDPKPRPQNTQAAERFQHMPTAGAPFHNSHSAHVPAPQANFAAYAGPDQQHSSVPRSLGKAPVSHTAETGPQASYGRSYIPQAHQPTNEDDELQYEPAEDVDNLRALFGQLYCPHFHARNKPQGGYRHTRPGDPYRMRVEFMAGIVKDTWATLSNVHNVPASVKICVVIHHIAKDYQRKYSEPAPFEMFLDGLNNVEAFSAVYDVQGLACKACMSSPIWPQDKRPLSFAALASHFYSDHGRKLMNQMVSPDDWRVNMVWLPDISALKGLGKVLRQQRPALRLVADALPWAFEDERQGGPNGSAAKESATHTATGHQQSSIHISHAKSKTPVPTTHQGPPDDSTSPSQDRPNLRPASIVYGRPTDTRHKPVYNTGSSGFTSGNYIEPPMESRRLGRDAHPQNPADRMDDIQRGRGVRAATHVPPTGRAVYAGDHGSRSDSRQRSVSPRPPFRYAHPSYRERSPRPTHAQVSHHQYEARHHPYSRYANEPPPHPFPPFETYEIVEVRDPQGDYFIRRPIPCGDTQVYAYTGRPGDMAGYPRYAARTTAYEYRPDGQPSAQRNNRPAATRSPEYEDYDPRYPSAIGGAEGPARYGAGS